MPNRPASSTPRVSVVIATYNRLPQLQRCLRHTRTALASDADGNAEDEIIVVDGGSSDGTVQWLLEQPDLRVHVEQQRGGCCAAYNLGLRMAHGHYVMWLNDDAFPLPCAIDSAIGLLESATMSDVGLVAFYHNHQQPQNELHGVDLPWPPAGMHDVPAAPGGSLRFGVLHVRGRPYANFGLLRNSLLRQLGWLDPGYAFCGWDPDLALKVQVQAGLRVLGAPDARVYHAELCDPRKQADAERLRAADNQRLFEKWKLPERGAYPDPRPDYLRLLQARGVLAAEPARVSA